MVETVIRKQKCSARINGQFDAMLYIVEAPHDGAKFYFGTGLVTTDFHRWFGEQVNHANATEDSFEGRVGVELEDGRIGRALISQVKRLDDEDSGSKIAFVFQGGLVNRCNHQEAPNEP